jgi:membrane associated rhomboid family serine protease
VSPSAAAVVYLVLLSAAVRASVGLGPSPSWVRRPLPLVTLAALLVVAVPSLVQLTAAPGLLSALERDRSALAAGQLWRLVTSLVVQDGGWPGTVFNLAALLLVGAAAERVEGRRRWLVVALVAGVGAQLWGLVVQPVGGGNSVVVFGLAAAVAVAAVQRGRGPTRPLGAVVLALGAVLLVTGDLHGGAVVLGAVTAVLLHGRVSSGAGVAARGGSRR